MTNKRTCAALAAVIASIFVLIGCGGGKVENSALSNKPAVSESPAPLKSGSVTIAAVGDIMLGTATRGDKPPNDGADMLRDFAPVLSAADITFGNLEGPLADSGVSAKCGASSGNCFAFRVPTRYGKYLKDSGFDVMSLANNHAGDFGDGGRVSTRRTLDDLGIKHAGSDRDAFAMTIVEAKGLKVAFIGFAHNSIVPNVNELDAARALVEKAVAQADLVVVSFHGGGEGEAAQNVPNRTETYLGESRGNLRQFARTVIDAGADLVIGHGPHVLRGMEIYKDRLIAYSMGNFATYGFGLGGALGLTAVFEMTLNADGTFEKGMLHSGRQYGKGGPKPDKSGEAVRKIRSLSIADFGSNAPKIADDGSISK